MDTKDIKLLRVGIAEQIQLPDIQNRLRDKQIDALRALVADNLTDEQIAHSYFKLPTGFGKTVMFSYMARAYFDAIAANGKQRQKIIIIVPRLSLIKQTQKKLAEFADISATEFSSRKKDNDCDVIITTYNSLGKLFGTVDFNDVGLIFADEAHHMLGDKISEKLEFYNKYVPVIGFTATPEYASNRAVANMLSTQIYSISISDGIMGGVLCPAKNILYRSSVILDLATVPARQNGEYDYENISGKIDPNILADEIAQIYANGIDEDTGTEFKKLRAIINCPDSKIANAQADAINRVMGRNVAVALHKVGISNNNFDRAQEDFIAGKYSVACQVGTMTEGFDDPTVAMCINYPTRSRVRAEQTAGRAIRIDENNPNKIAFIVDTVFRGTPHERVEDIFYTASNAQQVLFKDIAGDIFIYPEITDEYKAPLHGATQRKRNNIKFENFELITDSATLIELNRKNNEQIANSIFDDKNDNWQTIQELKEDPTFPMSNFDKIKKKMEDLQPFMSDVIQVRRTRNGRNALCLYRGARKVFLQRAGYGYVPPKTDEWQTANELAADLSFPSNTANNILKQMIEKIDDIPQFIQIRKPKYGPACPCLHRDGWNVFLGARAHETVHPKTDEWMSAYDLKADETFPMVDYYYIYKKLVELQPQMQDVIQVRTPKKGRECICLRADAREDFLKKTGYQVVPPKTPEWHSVNNLLHDPTFPMFNRALIRKALQKIQPKMLEFIQVRKQKNRQQALCLHIDGRELFLRHLKEIDTAAKTAKLKNACHAVATTTEYTQHRNDVKTSTQDSTHEK